MILLVMTSLVLRRVRNCPAIIIIINNSLKFFDLEATMTLILTLTLTLVHDHDSEPDIKCKCDTSRRYGVPNFFRHDLALTPTLTPRPSKSKQFTFGLTSKQNLVKFSPVIFNNHVNKAKKGISQHAGPHHDSELWAFDHKTGSIHPCSKTHWCCKFGENMTNTFQDIVLTMFGTHGQTDSTHRRTAWKHNASGHITFGGGIKNNAW